MKTNTFFRIKLIYMAYCLCICLTSCSDNPIIETKPLIDLEGNEYPIGKMCDGKYWMLKNLASTKFRNGDPIPYVYQAEWKDIPKDSAAYCTFGDSMVLTAIYGHLYNWYTVKDPRGFAPIGWHVPTEEEWKRLVDCNGGEEVAGARLKEAGSAHWKSGTGNNASGFTALPGDRRIDVPDSEPGIVAVFWTANPSDSCFAGRTPYYAMHDTGDNTYSNCGLNRVGFSVRCVRDE